MLPDRGDVDELIARAEVGDVVGARNGLREYTRRHPNMLLAWKWLADIADSPKERADCVRRAQLLAPGDPWLVEAKKQRLPPGVPRRAPGAELPTRPYPSPLAPAPAAPQLSFMRRDAGPTAQRPDDLMPTTTLGAWPHVTAPPPVIAAPLPVAAAPAPAPAPAAPVLVPLIDDLNEQVDELPTVPVAAPPLLAPPLLASGGALENGFADYPGSGPGGWLLGVAIGLAALGGLLIGLAWFINAG